MTRAKFLTRWVTMVVALSASLLWLHALGSGDLAAPPATPDGFRAWLDHTEFTVAVFALVRVVTVVLSYYALAITICGGCARLFSLPRMTAFIERFTLPFLRGALGSVALLGAIGTPATAAPQADGTTESVTLHLLPDDPPPTTTPAPEPVPAPIPADAPTSSPPADDSSWTVQHGDCFWQIANDHLRDTLGREVTEREVAAYWRILIEHNRSRLVTGDPDLLFAGQVIELPTVASG